LGEGFDNGEELAGLGKWIDDLSMGEGRFGSNIDEVCAFGLEPEPAANGIVGGKRNAFPIPRARFSLRR
jgi:hypothetical protein